VPLLGNAGPVGFPADCGAAVPSTEDVHPPATSAAAASTTSDRTASMVDLLVGCTWIKSRFALAPVTATAG
jgi:hypothetical protein